MAREQLMLAIAGMPHHTHVFIGIKPVLSLSDLVRDMKAASSGLINEKEWVKSRFSRQEGYGAFSYSHSQINRVQEYIRNQDIHHSKARYPLGMAGNRQFIRQLVVIPHFLLFLSDY